MRTRYSLVLGVSALALLAGPPPAVAQLNEPPTASFVSPAEGDTINARSTVTWTGSDPDGAIVQFQYALDPPDAFTPAEIADPENSPGVTVDTLPGPETNRDTLRVSKEVMGDLYSFDWIETPDTSEVFVFSTPDPDSILVVGYWVPAYTFSGRHVLHLRALDDGGAYSPTDSVAFTVETQVPLTQITRPYLDLSKLLSLGLITPVEWEGSDVEAPSGEPVSYLYKLLNLSELDPPVSIVTVTDPNILFTEGDSAWTPTDSLRTVLNLGVGQYVFGVRAVDESGAEEPFLQWGRNAFRFQAIANAGLPTLTIRESSLGTYSPGATVEFPSGFDLQFEVFCSAESYGGVCADWRWGVDIPDPGSDPGWSDWISDTTFLPTLSYSDGPHTLYVEVRDDVGSVKQGSFQLVPIAFPQDRDILWVDDVRDGTYPNDAQSTQFWQDRLAAYNDQVVGSGDPALQIDTFKVYGPEDRGTNQPQPPSLSTLGQYKIVVWECAGDGFNGVSGLFKETVSTGVLGSYLVAGGQVWLGGRMLAASTTTSDGTYGDFAYPLDLTDFPESFLYKYMKARTTRINRSADDKDSFYGALSAPGSPYATMDLDPNKLNQFQRLFGGVLNCEAIFDPILLDGTPGFEGKLDTLYSYGAAGNLFYDPPRPSSFHNKPCALRWSDPDPDAPHGKTQLFTFPLYYVVDGQAQETLNRSLDWFRGLEPSVAVELSSFTADWRDGSAVLHWEVASASDHAGFFIHRENAVGERVRLNETLLSGQLSYTFMDKTAPRGGGTYWLAEVSRAGVTSWIGPRTLSAFIPPRVLTLANAPNPFRASTEVAYTLPARTRVHLTVFDIQGRRVATLADGTEDPGEHTVTWDGRGDNGLPAASGLYFLHLRAGNEARVQKVILSR